MRRRISILFSLSFMVATAFAQTTLTKQRKLQKWAVPSGNYSGIAPLGDNRYAVISDKQESDGWSEMRIMLDEATGAVKDVEYLGFRSSGMKARDTEDIVFTGKNIFVCAEDDQRIVEHDMNGRRTGRELHVPAQLAKGAITSNYGFEALAYSPQTQRFYTCTENTLKADGAASSFDNPVAAAIRIQSFDTDLNPSQQYLYLTDAPSSKKRPQQTAFGVTAMTALPDGCLLVMEREFVVAKGYMGSYVTNKIYKVNPAASVAIDFSHRVDNLPGLHAMKKTLVAEWTTRLNLTRRGIANYEGMCLGPKTKDGRQTILVVSDSQGGYGNSLFHLKDYIKTILLP